MTLCPALLPIGLSPDRVCHERHPACQHFVAENGHADQLIPKRPVHRNQLPLPVRLRPSQARPPPPAGSSSLPATYETRLAYIRGRTLGQPALPWASIQARAALAFRRILGAEPPRWTRCQEQPRPTIEEYGTLEIGFAYRDGEKAPLKAVRTRVFSTLLGSASLLYSAPRAGHCYRWTPRNTLLD